MTGAQTITTTNPTNGTDLAEYPIHNESEVDAILDRSTAVQPQWAKRSFDERAEVLRAVGRELSLAVPVVEREGEGAAEERADPEGHLADHVEACAALVAAEVPRSAAWKRNALFSALA